MPVLFVTWLIGSGLCLSLGLLHLVAWSRGDGGVEHPWIALSAFSAGALALVEAWLSRTADISDAALALRLSNVCVAALTVSLAWFAVAYGGSTKRWLAWLATGGWVATLAISSFWAYPVPFAEISALESITWPWGETTSVPSGITSRWKAVPDLAVLATVLLALDAMLAARRGGDRRRGTLLGGIAVFLILALAWAALVDFGIVTAPYMFTYLFLAVVLIAGYELAGEVVRASRLSIEVRANEYRWRTLMEHMDMLVVGVDRRERINYANPFFCTVSGRATADVLGASFRELLPKDDRNSLDFNGPMRDRPAAPVELPLQAVDGTRRIVWSILPLHGADDVSSGALAIGLDVTERRFAESARDVALHRLQALTERLEEENLYLKQEAYAGHEHAGMVGASKPLKYVLHRVRQVAETDATVLILGETGVGKELVAQAVHEASGRADKPYIRLNCCVMPSDLAASELFGHERGAFTGAERRRKGRFELADTGTLFLDEIGELAPDLQVKLLRVLQEGEMERLGSSETFRVDVRLIAATNKDLLAEVEAGRFRADLYYRLNVYPITVPPLRDRGEDIPLLVRHFTEKIAASLGKPIAEVPGSVMRTFQRYDWPGNVRELRNVLERAVITSPTEVLRLPEPLEPASPAPVSAPGLVGRTLEEVERGHILEVLRLTHGQVAGRGGAADILGVAPSTLRYRIKKLGIDGSAAGETTPVEAVTQREAARRTGLFPEEH